MELSVNELKKIKEEELKDVICKLDEVYKEIDETRWNSSNIKEHLKKLEEMEKLNLRRRELEKFIDELRKINNDFRKKLITRHEEVMRFEEPQ